MVTSMRQLAVNPEGKHPLGRRQYESQKARAVEQVKADNPGADEEKLASLAAEAQKTVDVAQNEAALNDCVAGRVSDTLTPLTNLAGFPWQANITLIGAFAAKDVFVSTMATAYRMGTVAPEAADSLSERLAAVCVCQLGSALI